MSFTRQHYVKVAAVFAKERARHPGSADSLDFVAAKLADMFKEDNFRFDLERFKAACQERVEP